MNMEHSPSHQLLLMILNPKLLQWSFSVAWGCKETLLVLGVSPAMTVCDYGREKQDTAVHWIWAPIGFPLPYPNKHLSTHNVLPSLRWIMPAVAHESWWYKLNVPILISVLFLWPPKSFFFFFYLQALFAALPESSSIRQTAKKSGYWANPGEFMLK